MGFLDKYPYTDFHELNLDWFLERFRELADAVEDIQQTLAAITPLIESLPEYEQLTDQIKIVLYGDPDDPAYPNTGLIWRVGVISDALDDLDRDFRQLANDFDLYVTNNNEEIRKIKVTGIGTTLYQNLAAGQTSVQFTDDVIDVTTGNIRVEFFTSQANVHPASVSIAGNDMIVTFPDSYQNDIMVMARIGKYDNI